MSFTPTSKYIHNILFPIVNDNIPLCYIMIYYGYDILFQYPALEVDYIDSDTKDCDCKIIIATIPGVMVCSLVR